MPKLHNPQIVKIFFSSPFGGMEEEREELTRRYFPQIHHLCNAHGLQFAAVDMRWGITAESSDNFQVINICLREIDRSDMFIGFFGQRYGWHGAEDKMLQTNFDNAVGRYPWLDEVRDKSVTELEFLHGFLNQPGKLPAALFFRDKAYDDTVREEGVQRGDKKQVFKYSAESELSASLMDDLKSRVAANKDKSLGVYMDYKTPAEAAKIMFDIIMTYLKENLLADLDVKKLTKHEEILSQHDAFLASRCNIYVHGEQYLQTLNKFLHSGHTSHVLVTGDAGTGKSALLCNWISALKQRPSEYIVFYHFTGFAENSTDANSILGRMAADFENHYFTMVGGSSDVKSEEDTAGKDADEVTQSLIQRIIWATKQLAGLQKKPVIVIDGLDKVKVTGKIKKVLFWLPTNFPSECMVVVSTVTMDTKRIEELRSRKYESVKIEPLTTEAKHEMLVATLKESGKELSPSQVEKIISAEMTRLPLFLKVTLLELVSFGYFRLLDKKIDSLISSASVADLLKKVLERLGEDYNVADYDGNLVEQVMCCISLTYQGLSEMELKEIFNIPDHVWSPLYFAIEKLTVNQSGYLQFGFMEFKEAVTEKYLSQQDKKQLYLKTLISYFEKRLQKGDDRLSLGAADMRPVVELPRLWIEIGDKHRLVKCLSHCAIFYELEMGSLYDLVAMWQQTDLTGTHIRDILLQTFDDKLSQLYVHLADTGLLKDSETPGLKLESFLKSVDNFLSECGYHEARETVILRHIKVLTEGMKHGVVENREKVEDTLYHCKYRLACLKCEMYRQQEEGITLHEELLQYMDRRKDAVTKYELTRRGFAYNGIACGYLKLGNYDKVIEYCEKSIECHQKRGESQSLKDEAASYSNIGLALMEKGDREAALPYFDKSIKCYEEYHFGETPPVIGEILTNKALCLKRIGKLDEAESTYKKSLEVKINALGETHQGVAMAYMNMGALEHHRENYTKAIQYYKLCLGIYEAQLQDDPNRRSILTLGNSCSELKALYFQSWYKESMALDQTWTNVNYIQAWENILGSQLSMQNFKEMEDDFMKILDWRIKDKSMNGCTASVFREMARYFLREGKFESAHKTLYALLDSKHKDNDITYLLMDITLQNLPQSYREKLPKEFTMAAAVEQFPGSVSLVKHLVESQLVPAGDEDEIARLINQLHALSPDMAEDVYLLTLDWCKMGEQIVEKCYQRIVQEGLIHYPDNLDLHLHMAKSYRRQDRPDLALPHAKRVAEQQLDNPSLVFFTAHTAALCGQLDTCRRYCQHLQDTCTDQDQLEQVSKLLQVIEGGESTEDSQSEKTGEDSNTERQQ